MVRSLLLALAVGLIVSRWAPTTVVLRVTVTDGAGVPRAELALTAHEGRVTACTPNPESRSP